MTNRHIKSFEDIKKGAKDNYFKIDLKNNTDEMIVKYCEHFYMKPEIIISLKRNFKYDSIWTLHGIMKAYEKDGVFYEVDNNDGLTVRIDDYFDLDFSDDDLMDIAVLNFNFTRLSYSQLKSISVEIKSFSFEEENCVIDDTLNEETNIDRIFDKINEVGLNNLTYRERKILDDYSKSL